MECIAVQEGEYFGMECIAVQEGALSLKMLGSWKWEINKSMEILCGFIVKVSPLFKMFWLETRMK